MGLSPHPPADRGRVLADIEAYARLRAETAARFAAVAETLDPAGDVLAVNFEEVCRGAPIMLTVSEGPREIARTFRPIGEHIDWLGELLRHQARAAGGDAAAVVEWSHRADEAFRLAGDCDRLLERLNRLPRTRATGQLGRDIETYRNRSLRYNRATIPPAAGPVAVIPIAHTRTFLRDGCERMYFLALHPLPTAYDFFCTTHVVAPVGYRQEVHLHRSSAELTLVLDGEADCVWYEEDAGGALIEAGRCTAGPLEAFRIPPCLPHAIHNPARPNRNLTVKLSPFIEDRVGERDWRFPAEPKRAEPVTIERGSRAAANFGAEIRYDHGHQGLRFRYSVSAIAPDRKIHVTTESFLFLFEGTIGLTGSGLTGSVRAASGAIVRIAAGIEAELTNLGPTDALLFGVEGLDYRHFLAHSNDYSGYPRWLIDDIRQTLSAD